MSNSLDPDQDRHSGFKMFAKGYWQTTKFSAGMQRVITVVFNILSNIGSFQLRYTCNVYHKYSDTLNTFHMLCPFKQSEINIQRVWLESVLLTNAKLDTVILSKVFISFV